MHFYFLFYLYIHISFYLYMGVNSNKIISIFVYLLQSWRHLRVDDLPLVFQGDRLCLPVSCLVWSLLSLQDDWALHSQGPWQAVSNEIKHLKSWFDTSRFASGHSLGHKIRGTDLGARFLPKKSFINIILYQKILWYNVFAVLNQIYWTFQW